MQEPPTLTMMFVGHAPVRIEVPANADELEVQLQCAWEAGRDPWPQLSLPANTFIRHLAQRLPQGSEGRPLMQWLDQLVLADLYLACACIHEVPAAIPLLESHYLAKLPALLGHLNMPTVVLDDVCQLVRIHLLMGSQGTGPHLAEYTGRGALLSWIRVMALRMALRQSTSIRQAPAENVLAVLEAMPAPGADTELYLIKHRYRPEFRHALCEAFASLSAEQRYQLRLHFVERLSMTEMSTLFRVNQSTVSRWLKSARQAVHVETKRLVRERLGLSTNEFTSLMRAIESDFGLSLSEVLKA